MHHPPVSILMATHNGAPFVREQIESIRAQTFSDWTLFIRDDASTDKTATIISEAASTDARIVIITDGRGRLGVTGSFSALATYALTQQAGPVLFADQDDVWFPTKVEHTLATLQNAEAARRPNTPVMVHSDLVVADRLGQRRHQSFMRFQRIRHEDTHALRTLLVQNFVTGCTVMVNRPLLELATPIPGAAVMHDWWMALCAAACGTIAFLPEPTMAYRRHEANAVSVRGFWRTMNPVLTDWRALWRDGVVNHSKTVDQARALVARLRDTRPGNTGAVAPALEMVDAFIALHAEAAPRLRLTRALHLGLKGQTWPRTAVLYARLLCRA